MTGFEVICVHAGQQIKVTEETGQLPGSTPPESYVC